MGGWRPRNSTQRACLRFSPRPAPPLPNPCRLLRYALPACGGRAADVRRVLAAGAVLPLAGDVLAALAPSRLQRHLQHN